MDEVSVGFIVDGVTHAISEEIVLRMQNETLEVIIAASCINDHDRRNRLLSEKIVQLFPVESRDECGPYIDELLTRINFETSLFTSFRQYKLPEPCIMALELTSFTLIIIGLWYLHRLVGGL